MGLMPRRHLDLVLSAPLALVALLVILLYAAPAGAQSAATPATQPPPAPAVSDQDIDQLTAVLNDPALRDKLIAQLKALKAANAAANPGTSKPAETAAAPKLPAESAAPVVEPRGLGATLVSAMGAKLKQLGDGLSAGVQMLSQLPELGRSLAAEAGDPTMRARWLDVALKLAIVLLAALLGAWLASWLASASRRALSARSDESRWLHLPLAVLRVVVELIPVAAFAVVAYVVLPATGPWPSTRLIVIGLVNAIVVARTIAVVAQVLLLPQPGCGPLLPLSDETGSYLYVWIRRLSATVIYGAFLVQAVGLLGVPPGPSDVLLRLLGLVTALLLVVLVLQNRTTVADRLRGRSETGVIGGLRHRLADIWHVLAIFYIMVTYAIWALDIGGGFMFLVRVTLLSAAILGLLRLAMLAVRWLVSRLSRLSADLRQRFPFLEARVNRYLPLVESLLDGLLYAVAALALLAVWGIDVFAWLDGELGRRIAVSLADIVVIVLIAVALLEGVSYLIERYLAASDRGNRPASRSARVRTLLPLIRNVFRIALLVVVALVVLSEIGINIAPLLAGAGVVGLAVGFGAQTLVKDVITGFFILAEDTIAIGDVIDLDGRSGVVEAMTIRTIRVRDVAGAVYTVPFSAVTVIKNLTKNFAYAIIDVSLTYRADLGRATQLLNDIAKSLREDPAFKADILGPLDIMGVDSLRDVGALLRARMMTVPGAQWRVSRAFYARLLDAFAANGIDPPVPAHVLGPPVKAAE
jgi:moderate conductance mechanosensitive channel